MNTIILVGGFNEIIDLAEECNKEIVGIIDNSEQSFGKYSVIGTDIDITNFNKEVKSTPVIITPDIPKIREKLHKLYKQENFTFSNLISNKAMVSSSAKINVGSVIQRGVNVSADVVIGSFVKLNVNSNVMHNSIVGDYTTIAPNAVILGNVKLGERCYVGANATVLPNIEVCEDVVIGAGAVVTKNITKPGKYAGVPAKLL